MCSGEREDDHVLKRRIKVVWGGISKSIVKHVEEQHAMAEFKTEAVLYPMR